MNKQLALPAIPAKLRPKSSSVKGAKRQTPEFNEQKALFQFLRGFAHIEPRFAWVFAIPNGLFLTPKTAQDAIAQGVTAGVWDIMVPFAGYLSDKHGLLSYALFIEMKHGKNKLTDAQIDFERSVCGGYGFVVAYSWLDAARAIVEYLGCQDKAILEAIK